MKKIFVVITIGLLICCDKRADDNRASAFQHDQISDDEIYDVINSIINGSDSECLNRTQYFTESQFFLEPRLLKQVLDGISELDSIFSERDVEFIRSQAEKLDEFKLSREFVQRKKVIPNDSLKILMTDQYSSQVYRDNFKKKYGSNDLGSIALPLFSVDRKTVVIATTCGMGFGSGGGFDIYHKKNGKWTWLKGLVAWIS